MGRKQVSNKRARDDAGEPADQAGPSQNTPEATAGGQRKDAMHEIARRRAAHFAHFQADDEANEEEAANVHVGGDEASRLGPWSSARELVEARGEAAAARQGRLEGQRGASVTDALVDWSPSRPLGRGPPRLATQKVPRLIDRCIVTIADCINCVESLYGLPQCYVTQLALAVADRRKMTPEAFQLFTENNPTEVVLSNCTQVNEADMAAGLKACCTYCLDTLALRFCGRGMGEHAVSAIVSRAPLTALKRLELSGAYRLGSNALLQLLGAAPNLRHLLLPQCIRLQGPEVISMAELVPHLVELDLASCGGLDTAALVQGLPQLQHLERLQLSEAAGVDDDVLEAAAKNRKLVALGIRRCLAVTDAGVTAVATNSPNLAEIELDAVPITGAALQALADHCPQLTHLSVRGCRRVKAEAPLIAVAGLNKLKRLDVTEVAVVGAATLKALGDCCPHSLAFLDISFCRGVPPAALGLLADTCKNLDVVRIYGCTQMTPDAVHGHSNATVRILGEPTYLHEGEDAPAAELLGVEVKSVKKKGLKAARDAVAAPQHDLFPDIEII